MLVDAQNEYVSGKLPLNGIAAAITETSRLLDKARATGTPVIHIVHLPRRGDLPSHAAHTGPRSCQSWRRFPRRR